MSHRPAPPRPPLRDVQRDPPRALCPRCGAELYRWDPGPLCPLCAPGPPKA